MSATCRGTGWRPYRVARGIVRDEAEAEDVVQEAYVRAFAALGEFRGDSGLATWLTRIVMNEALGRVRRRTTHGRAGEPRPNPRGR
jgi:RNA polymerase sigma factor (sigma-70 family)